MKGFIQKNRVTLTAVSTKPVKSMHYPQHSSKVKASFRSGSFYRVTEEKGIKAFVMQKITLLVNSFMLTSLTPNRVLRAC